MTKLVMIHTVSKFRHAYAVRVDDDADLDAVANMLITNQEDDLYQTFCGEYFETSYPITEDEVVKLFDTNYGKITDRTDQEKLQQCIKDYTSKNIP